MMGIKIEVKLEVLERDRWKCVRCGIGLYLRKSYKVGTMKKAHLHHIVPRNKNGSNASSNLLSTCWKCECIEHGHIGKYSGSR